MMAITNVSVTSTNTLILSLDAKSFYMAKIWFDNVLEDCNQTTVASIVGEMVEVQKPNTTPYWTFQFEVDYLLHPKRC